MLLLARKLSDSCAVNECVLSKHLDISNVQTSFIFLAFFSDRRLADHFGGKLHLGYMQIREKLAELQVDIC